MKRKKVPLESTVGEELRRELDSLSRHCAKNGASSSVPCPPNARVNKFVSLSCRCVISQPSGSTFSQPARGACGLRKSGDYCNIVQFHLSSPSAFSIQSHHDDGGAMNPKAHFRRRCAVSV